MEFQEFYKFRNTLNIYLEQILKYVNMNNKFDLSSTSIDDFLGKTIVIKKDDGKIKRIYKKIRS